MFSFIVGLMFRYQTYRARRISAHPVYLKEVMDPGEFNVGGAAIRTGRTVHEYDQEIDRLNKENFNLKLRLYLMEEKSCHGEGDNGQSSSLEVDVQLKYETESLRKEIAAKNKLLDDALSQVEKYQNDLDAALNENIQLKNQIDTTIEVDKKCLRSQVEKYEKDLDVALRQNAQLQDQLDATIVQNSEKINTLKSENATLQEKVRKSTIAIQGFAIKFNDDWNHQPKELRPIIKKATQAAKELDRELVVSSVNEFKDCLCQIMDKPYKDVFGNEFEQIKCLENELYKQKKHCKSLEKKLLSVSSESKKPLQELKSILSEKEAALKNHIESYEANNNILCDVQNQLEKRNTAVDLIKKLLMCHLGFSDDDEDISLKPFNMDKKSKQDLYKNSSEASENQSECLQNIDSLLKENQEMFDNDESLKQISILSADIMRSNAGLKAEIDDQVIEINTLTATSSELEQKIITLQSDLYAAKSKVQQLEKRVKEKKDKLTLLSKLNTSTQTDVASMEQSIHAEHSDTDIGQSSEIINLKDDICSKSLYIEQLGKKLQDLQQNNAFLQAKLEDARNQIEMKYVNLEEDYNCEVAKLHKELSKTHYVNIKLVNQLQNLEIFMEKIVKHENLELSSFENVSEMPDSFSTLSQCLHQIRLLSTTLSENLSMYDSSRMLDMEEDSMSLNPELFKNQSTLEKGSTYLSVLQPTYKSWAISSTKEDEGKSILTNNDADINNSCSVRTGKRRTWSNSAQITKNPSIFNSDGASILGLSVNEEAIIQLDECDEPISFENNQMSEIGNAAGNSSFQNSDLNRPNSLSRRRCWGEELSSLNFFTNVKSNSPQTTENKGLNRYGGSTNLCATWYNPGLTSDSDIWSEPDRDVSMQRIGIDVRMVSPVVPKSPCHKLRVSRTRQDTDDISTEKSSVPHGCVKAQSWSRRRRSSGSTPKRLLAKKDSRLDKHLSLLREECPRFVSLLRQFESTKELNFEKAEVLTCAYKVLKRLQCTICETTEALVVLKDKSKNGAPVSCQQCIVNDLRHEIENSMEKINDTNLIQEATGTVAEQVVHRILSEVDNLNKQLEESTDIHSSAMRSLQFASEQEQPTRENAAQKEAGAEIARVSLPFTGQERLSREDHRELATLLKNLELEKKLSEQSEHTKELKILLDELKEENGQLVAKQILSGNLCEQLKKELKQTKMRLEEMISKCVELEGRLEATSGAEDSVDQLSKKCDNHEAEISKLQSMLVSEQKNISDLRRENGDYVTENGQLENKLAEECKKINELDNLLTNIKSEKIKFEKEIIDLKANAISSDSLQTHLKEVIEKSTQQIAKLNEKLMQQERAHADQLLKKYEEFQGEKMNLEKALQDVIQKADALKNEKDELIRAKRNLESISSQLEEKLSDEDVNTSHLRRSFNRLESEKTKSEMELLHFKTNAHNMYDFNRQLTEKLDETEMALEESNSKCNQYDKQLLEMSELKMQADKLVEEKNCAIIKLEDELIQFEILKIENNELLKKCEEYENEIAKLQKEAEEMLLQAEGMKSEKDELIKANKHLKSITSQLEEKLSDEDINVGQLKKSFDKLESEKTKSEMELVHFKTNAHSIYDFNRQLTNKMDQTQLELEESNSKYNDLVKKCEEQNDVIKNFEDEKIQFESLKIENAKLIITLQNMQTLNAELDKGLKYKKEQLKKLKNENEQLSTRIKDLELNNDKLNAMLSDESSSLAQLKSLNEELKSRKTKSEAELMHLKTNSNSLSESYKKLNSKLEQTQLQLENSVSKCKQYERELSNMLELKKDADELSQKCEEQKAIILKSKEMLRDYEPLKAQKYELELLNSNLTEEKNSLVKKLGEKMEELKIKTSSLENLVSDLENKNKALLIENEHAQGDLAATSYMSEQLSKDLANTKEKLKFLETKCSNYEQKLSDSVTAQGNFTQNLQALEIKCNDYDKELKESLVTKDNLIQKFQALKSKLVFNKLQLSNVEKMQSLSKALSKKDMENKENQMFSLPSKSSFDSKDKQLEELCENIILENDGLTGHIQMLVKKLNESKAALQQSIAAEEKYQQELTSLQNKLELQEMELNSLKEQMEHSQMQIQSLEREHQYDAKSYQNQVKMLEDDVSRLKKQEQEAVLEKQASGERLQELIASVQNQLETGEGKINDLQKENENLLEHIASLESKHQDEIVEIQKQLEIQDFELSDLRKRRESLLLKIGEKATLIGKSVSGMQTQSDEGKRDCDLTAFQNQIQMLNDEVARLENQKEMAVLQKQASAERLQKIALSIQDQLKAREDEVNNLKRDKEQVLKQSASLEKIHQQEVASIQKQLLDQDSQLAELRRQNEIISKMNKKPSSIDESDRYVPGKQIQSDENQYDLASMQYKIKMLEEEMENLMKQKDNIVLQKKASGERQQLIITSIHNQLKTREDEIIDLKQQGEQVLNRSSSLEKEHQDEIAIIQNQLKIRDIELTELKQQKEILAKIYEKSFPGEHVQSLDDFIQKFQLVEFGEQKEDKATALIERDQSGSGKQLPTFDDKHQIDLSSMQNQVKILQEEIENLKKQKEQALLERRSSGERQQQIAASIQNQLNIREDELVDLKKQRDQILKRNQSFEKKYQYEIASLQNELKVRESELSELKTQNEVLLAKIDEKQTFTDRREKSATFLRSQIQLLQDQNRTLQSQVSEAKLSSKNKESEITTLHEKVFNLQLQINNIMKEKAEQPFDKPFKEKSSSGATQSGYFMTPINQMDSPEEVKKLQSTSVSPIKLIYSKHEGLSKIPRDHSLTPVNYSDSTTKQLQSPIGTQPPPTKLSSHDDSFYLKDADKSSHPSNISLDTNASSLSVDTDSLYTDPLTLKRRRSETDKDADLFVQEIRTLRERLGVAEDQVELLEREKREIREHLTAQVSDKKSILKTHVDEKLEFQLQLDKKDAFIKDLKVELSKTSNMLIDKQREILSLEKTISEYETRAATPSQDSILQTQKPDNALSSKLVNEITALKNENFKLSTELMELQKFERHPSSSQSVSETRKSQQYSFLDSENSVISVDAEKVRELSKLKWNTIKTIFALQKKFYEERALDFSGHQSFVNSIENQFSLRFSNFLSKCISEPILRSSPPHLRTAQTLKEDSHAQNVLDSLELDIECMQNFKMFLEKFALPYAVSLPGKNALDERRLKSELSVKLSKISQLETHIKQLEGEKSSLHSENAKLQQLLSVQSYESIEKLRGATRRMTSLTFNKGELTAFDVAEKISFIEDILKSLEPDLKIAEISSLTELHRNDTYSESVKRSMLLKLLEETRMWQKNADKVFQLNSTMKFIYGLGDQEYDKFSIADKELLLADDTLTISRSASLSPVSFDDLCPSKEVPLRQRQSSDLEYLKINDKPVEISKEHCYDEPHSSYKLENIETIGSSQDSVCHRSHYSSPDLGIESDPNHESSAPEQAEKDTYATVQKAPTGDQSDMEMKFKYSVVDTRLRWPFSLLDKMKSKDNAGAMGDTLYAIGALQDYELLKQEVQESLVEIKSVLSRTKDGLQYISKYVSPRKSMEHNTFKDIRDTCISIEVYLTEAGKLIDNFCVAPYPTADEWNGLIQKNNELSETLTNLRWKMQKQQNEFNDAMKELKHAQMVKDSMEKKMSKKLVKTKKVLKLATMQLQEPNLVYHDCHSSLPNKDPAVPSACHSSKGSS